jgi:hypothetical protein
MQMLKNLRKGIYILFDSFFSWYVPVWALTFWANLWCILVSGDPAVSASFAFAFFDSDFFDTHLYCKLEFLYLKLPMVYYLR